MAFFKWVIPDGQPNRHLIIRYQNEGRDCRPHNGELRPICTEPHCNLLAIKNTYNGGYASRCRQCQSPDRAGITGYRQKKLQSMKVLYCEKCHITNPDASIYQVDHIDGNFENDDLENLNLLCVPCHKKKTITNGDHLPRHMRGLPPAKRK